MALFTIDCPHCLAEGRLDTGYANAPVQPQVTCELCDGLATVAVKDGACTTCAGSGLVRNFTMELVECGSCHGDGYARDDSADESEVAA